MLQWRLLTMARAYEAEQKSVDVACRLLDGAAVRRPSGIDTFGRFRARAFPAEYREDTVMATDLFDKDMNSMRELRWRKTFGAMVSFQDASPRARQSGVRCFAHDAVFFHLQGLDHAHLCLSV